MFLDCVKILATKADRCPQRGEKSMMTFKRDIRQNAVAVTHIFFLFLSLSFRFFNLNIITMCYFSQYDCSVPIVILLIVCFALFYLFASVLFNYIFIYLCVWAELSRIPIVDGKSDMIYWLVCGNLFLVSIICVCSLKLGPARKQR